MSTTTSSNKSKDVFDFIANHPPKTRLSDERLLMTGKKILNILKCNFNLTLNDIDCYRVSDLNTQCITASGDKPILVLNDRNLEIELLYIPNFLNSKMIKSSREILLKLKENPSYDTIWSHYRMFNYLNTISARERSELIKLKLLFHQTIRNILDKFCKSTTKSLKESLKLINERKIQQVGYYTSICVNKLTSQTTGHRIFTIHKDADIGLSCLVYIGDFVDGCFNIFNSSKDFKRMEIKVKEGDLVLFHGKQMYHNASAISSGTRYSIVFYTKRSLQTIRRRFQAIYNPKPVYHLRRGLAEKQYKKTLKKNILK